MGVVKAFCSMSFLMSSLGSESSTFGEFSGKVVLSENRAIIFSCLREMAEASKLSLFVSFVHVSGIIL